MPKREDSLHSVLIISSSEQFDALVRKALQNRSFVSREFRKSAAMARRCLLERYFDLVVINAPLSDETGEDIALDISEKSNASVVLAVPQEVYESASEMMTDHGILVVPKPFSADRLSRAVGYLAAIQNRIHALEKRVSAAQEKLEETRVVTRAKLLLMEKKKISEGDAHRLIGKLAMDNGVSRQKVAMKLLDELE